MKGNNNVIVLIMSGLIIMFVTMQVVENMNTDVIYVKSTIDSREYLVRNLPDKQQAADFLCKVRRRLRKVCKEMQLAYPKDERVKRLNFKFRSENISENSGNNRYTSYSVNKGQEIYLCIRQRDQNNEIIDFNTMLFVALHELAHVMTISTGHTKEFWDNFKYILKFCIDNGLYEYQAFHRNPKKYCGTMITDTPYKLS